MSEDWKGRAISWLGRNNSAQQIWAVKYLGKKNWFSRGRRFDESNYDYFVAHIRQSPDVLERIEDLRKMKRAWSQKKKRDKKAGETKSYSFIMSKSIGPKLRYLKRKQGEPAYKILEKIIFAYEGEVKSNAWPDLNRQRIEQRLKKVDQKIQETERRGRELDAKEKEVKRQVVELTRRTEELEQLENEALEFGESLDSERDLISQLVADYADVIKAQTLDKWVIRRKFSQPAAPLNYQGQSKFLPFLFEYQDLLAKLKR